MGRLIALTKKPIIKPLSIYWMRLRQQPIMMGSWLRMLRGIMQINEDSADHNSLTLIFQLKTESLDNAILEL